MNIAVIGTYDRRGGAATASYRLYKGLKQAGENAFMLVKDKSLEDDSIITVTPANRGFPLELNIFNHIRSREIKHNRTELSNTLFSLPYPGCDFSWHPVIAASHILNLHWVARFQSVETISRLLQQNKPVVWTLHDENAYTGGCHYTAGCTKYRDYCEDCPQLTDNTSQIPFHVLKNKEYLWNHNLTIVTPSQWLGDCVKKSRLFKNRRIEVIPNSLETDVFKPKAKAAAKEKLGIEPHCTALLFGSHTGTEKRKGFSKLLEAIKYCLQEDKFKHLVHSRSIKILTFGPPQQDLETLGLPSASFGYINEMEQLATLYAAADIFVLPSLEDNLPNTMLEAMACGTPVVSFALGGMPDLIRDGVTGYMAPCCDSEKLGEAILKLVFDPGARKQMERNCRQLCEEKFTLQHQAQNYLDLFNDLLKDKKNSLKTGASTQDIARCKEIVITGAVTETGVQPELFPLYRKAALEVITKLERINRVPGKNPSLNHDRASLPAGEAPAHEKPTGKIQDLVHLQELLRQKEKEIEKIKHSFSYKIGKGITFPLKIFRKVLGKRIT